MSEPLVTVIIPTQDRPAELARALQSVAVQGWGERLGVVVVDDASEVPVEKGALERIPAARVLRREEAGGAAAARNRGAEVAATPWLAFLDDDDVWLPGKLDAQMRALEHSRADWSCTGMAFMLEGGRLLHELLPPDDPREVLDHLAEHNVVGMPSLVVRRDVWRSLGGMDERFLALNDYDLVVRLAQAAPGVTDPEVYVHCFASPKRASISSTLEKHMQGRRLLLEKHADFLASKPGALARHRMQMGQKYALHGSRRAARREFLAAFRAGGRRRRALLHLLAVNLPLGLYNGLGDVVWRAKQGSPITEGSD